MDREIPKEVRNKERNKKIIRYGAIGVAGIVVVSVLISLMRTGVKEKDLVFSQVGKGTIEVSVSASGKVVPAFEEIINSPIDPGAENKQHKAKIKRIGVNAEMLLA